MSNEVQKFRYNNKERLVFVISKASENLLAIDLSVFPEHLQEIYIEELKAASASTAFIKAVADIGLDACYRSFNKDKIQYEDDTST